jgi:signal transduction histidine kinase
MSNWLGEEISEKRQLQLKTYVYVGTLIASAFCLVTYFLDVIYLRFLFTITVGLCFVSLYLLKSKPKVARLVFLFDYLLTVLFVTPIIGKEAIFYVYYGFFLLLLTLLFSFNRERKHIIFFASLTFIFWFFLIYVDANNLGFREIDSTTSYTYFYPLTIIGNIVFLTTTLISFFKENNYYTDIANDRKEEALKLLKLKNVFLNAINEEIREPLNSIVGATHILRENNSRPDQLEYIKSLQLSSTNLLDLFTNVISLNSLTSHKLALNSTSTNLNTLIENTIQIYSTACEKKNIKLEFLSKNELPNILLDNVRYQQILNNLLSNAIKFTNNGAITIEISSSKISDSKVKITTKVIDTGIGISKDKVDVIWEPFKQATNSTTRFYGGSGLGLPIVKKIVKKLGGEIKVTTALNKGATFYFDIPVKIAKTVANEELKNTSKLDLNSSENKVDKVFLNKRVLITDDNRINLLVLKNLLEKRGAITDQAVNGKESVAFAEQNEYDLILMDLNMPVMSGQEAITKIRTFNKTVPIIIITASNSFNLDEFKNQNIHQTIRKPFDPEILLKTLKASLL